MAKPKSELLQTFVERGYLHQCTDMRGLDDLARKGSIVGYIGFDSTSDSLHIGSLVQLMLLHWLDYFGHKTIALMGGGTTLVGDPSGKDESRKILRQEDIENNIAKIEKTFSKFIDLKDKAKRTLTETVGEYKSYLPKYFPVPHPSPTNRFWRAKNPWFEELIVQELQDKVKAILK